MFLQISGNPHEIVRALDKIKGINNVERDQSVATNDSNGFIVSLTKGTNVAQSIPPVIISNNWNLIEMRSLDANLEDVFIQLVTNEDQQ